MSLEAVLLGDSWYIIVIVPIFWDVSAESLLLYHVFCDSEGALQSLTESLYIFLTERLHYNWKFISGGRTKVTTVLQC